MPTYRHALPQLADGALMLTDGGLETTLVFHDGIDLPHFAACELTRSESGKQTLLDYFTASAKVAADHDLPFSIDTPTWRANTDWTDKLGFSDDEFVEANLAGIRMAQEIRERFAGGPPMVIAAVIGPRGDGYRPENLQSAEEAERYHDRQMAIFADSEADYVVAVTMNYSDEALGIAQAARRRDMPVVISFTVETDGRLAPGETLAEAIAKVDDATDAYPAYYMVNCAHPTHLPEELTSGADWTERVRGFRANASSQSHAELDEAEELDDGDLDELAEQFRELRLKMPQLAVLGGCCGSDHRHIAAIAAAVTA